MSFRLEKNINSQRLYKIKSNLIKTGMSKLYPSRVINSTYYDNENLKCIRTLKGLLPRKKFELDGTMKLKGFFMKLRILHLKVDLKKQKILLKI